ncbi:MAG: hypothetical protein FJ014_18200 [Chloroflexi bacterium]|nr:hypothetical protein [Chloroflexota bacterium]
MGGWNSVSKVFLSLWIENAHQSLVGAGLAPALEEVCGDVVRTFQTEEQFFAILASGPQGGAEGRAKATLIADRAASMLQQETSLDTVVERLLDALPSGEHLPFSILQVLGGCRAYLVECDAPPLFLTRGGRLVLLPVLEDISRGRLVRECRFSLQDGDHMAMVSEGYIHAKGWSRRWGWRDVAISTRRWTETGCDAEQLLGALIRTYRRLAPPPISPACGGEAVRDVTVIAMHVRPRRSATVWSGPPADPTLDRAALEKLMAEPGVRIICGDTTAQIAARLLRAELELEPRPEDGWAEVPPVLRLEGVDLVTEGLVTLHKARERMAGAKRGRDLPRGEDGATRLARALLTADKIHFIVGLAVNPAQVADATRTVPLRQAVVEELMHDLKARGKLVSVEYL